MRDPPAGWDWFVNWVKEATLVEDNGLWFGSVVTCSFAGSGLLKSAYRYVIGKFESGRSWNGEFNQKNFLVRGDGKEFMISKQAAYQASISGLFADLKKLGHCLIYRFKYKGVAAIYTEHLKFFTENPPPECAQSEAYLARYLSFVKYHFVFADPAARSVLVVWIGNASSWMGSGDRGMFHMILQRAWDSLQYGSHDWIRQARLNPIFDDVITYKSFGGYRRTPISLYQFARHTEVHGPEKTLAEITQGPAQAAQGGAAAAPQGMFAAPAPGQAVPQMMPTIQTMLNPLEINLMLGQEFGDFIAQGTALVLIDLQMHYPAYIDEGYELYKKAIDTIYDSNN